jgi:pimeloyl-ACP methyl ester carboxylesterase
MNDWKPIKPSKDIEIFNYRNTKIAYKYYNKKSSQNTILFLYGFGANILMVDQFAPVLSSYGYTILTMDYPGHGYSPIADNISIDFLVEIIIKLLKKLKEKKIILIGYSFGGIVALSFYKKYSNNIDNFILVHSSYYFKNSIYKKIIFNFFRKMLVNYYNFTINYFAIPILRDFYFSKNQIKNARNTAMKNNKKSVIKMFDLIINKNMIKVLKIINCPALIIGSHIDILVSSNTSKKTSKMINNSKLKIFKFYGHYSIMSKPDEVAKIIDNFIKN